MVVTVRRIFDDPDYVIHLFKVFEGSEGTFLEKEPSAECEAESHDLKSLTDFRPRTLASPTH